MIKAQITNSTNHIHYLASQLTPVVKCYTIFKRKIKILEL